ncbi:hypothetical protein [Cellulophaga omnivescoria]|uniref:hypothetical protein n=1 Tax=Cellulophaga omnivescoria TaxID=1888890 RepID=UPI0022F0EC9E|nr:hypothetical protein [Cellulophaga omnivescoria]WBU90707.1 hypothetical protein PBN93_06740 [Cellulophaga omnivescoria]
MISSFFGKTKPINYIIVLTLLLVFYGTVRFFGENTLFTLGLVASNIGIVAVLFFTIFLVNFIVKRNKITKANSFAVLFYGLLCVFFPASLTDTNGIFCSFFIVLATRKILSLKSLKEIKYKIFDASMWIIVASLFYDWALLYLVWVYIAIYIYEPKNIRNWFLPLSALVTVALITSAVFAVLGKFNFVLQHYVFTLNINADMFREWSKSSATIVYLIVVIIVGVVSSVKLGKSGVGRLASMRLVAVSFTVGIFITLFETSLGYFPIMITFFPAAVFLTNYIEILRKPRFKELNLFIAIVVPITVFVFKVILK